MHDHDPSRGALPLAPGKPAQSVDEALLSRRSLRAFRPNVQPWKVHVVAGEIKDRMAAEMVAGFLAHGEEGWRETYAYYPTRWREPYLGRRRKLGWDLYGLLGIGKGEREKTKRQHARNFRFFDAPVALIFLIDADLERGSWLDYGMFLQSVMLAARGFGLDTCPQAAIARAHEVLRRHLPIADSEIVVCGMSLGYARADAIENALVTEREPVERFARFFGF
jgi:nitroreductase